MWEYIVLALIQAATEFLPISSSGHLALFGHLFSSVDVSYYVFLHLASLLAIIVYTRRELLLIVRGVGVYRNYWLYVLIGILPAALVGFLFADIILAVFSSLRIVGILFFIMGGILLMTHFYHSGKNEHLTWKRSLFIGLVQIFALLPGISRSGSTISAGLFSGLPREEAFRFSFVMAIPLILGAVLLEGVQIQLDLASILGFLICAVASFGFLMLLEVAVRRDLFWIFSIYLFVIGLTILLVM